MNAHHVMVAICRRCLAQHGHTVFMHVGISHMHKSSSMLGRAYGLGSCMLIPKKYLEPLSLVLGDISLHHVNKVCNIQ